MFRTSDSGMPHTCRLSFNCRRRSPPVQNSVIRAPDGFDFNISCRKISGLTLKPRTIFKCRILLVINSISRSQRALCLSAFWPTKIWHVLTTNLTKIRTRFYHTKILKCLTIPESGAKASLHLQLKVMIMSLYF